MKRNFLKQQQLSDSEFEAALLAAETVHPELPACLCLCRGKLHISIVRHLDKSCLNADFTEIHLKRESGVIRQIQLNARDTAILKKLAGLNKKRSHNNKLFPGLAILSNSAFRCKYLMVLRRCGLPRSRSINALSWRSPEDQARDEEIMILELIRNLERKWVPGLKYKGREAPVPPGYAPLQVIARDPESMPEKISSSTDEQSPP